MPIGLPSLGLIYALLVLVPGYITYIASRRFGKITRPYDRFDKSIFTLLGSGASISILVIGFSSITQQPINEVVNGTYALTEIAKGYLILLIIAGILGIIIGVILNHGIRRHEDIRTKTTWQLVSEEKKEPAKVNVVMSNGDEIWGEVYVSDSEPHGQDLLLKWPQEIIREEDGTVKERIGRGKFTFLAQSGISEIYFDTEIDI